MDSEGYMSVDSIAGDKQFSLEGGKQFFPKEDTHYSCGEDKHWTLGEDKVVVLEDPKWDLGCSDKVVHKIVWKEQDLILFIGGYGIISPQRRVE